MNIADNIIRNRLENVYFLWGRGKTTIANQLHEKKGFYYIARMKHVIGSTSRQRLKTSRICAVIL